MVVLPLPTPLPCGDGFHACSQAPVLSVPVPSHLTQLNTGECAKNCVCLDAAGSVTLIVPVEIENTAEVWFTGRAEQREVKSLVPGCVLRVLELGPPWPYWCWCLTAAGALGSSTGRGT